MARIIHIAIKVEDLEVATKFYEDVFGLRQTGTGHARGHTSRHMTDGDLDVALMVYDNEEVHEAQLSGAGPCMHHWGIEVQDFDAATRFYENVFGFKQVTTGRNHQHISRHMTDGNFDLALMLFDSEDAHEAQLAGPGPRIHHWGMEVDDRDGFTQKIAKHGGTILSKPDSMTIKFRAPDGTHAEIVRTGRYEKLKKQTA